MPLFAQWDTDFEGYQYWMELLDGIGAPPPSACSMMAAPELVPTRSAPASTRSLTCCAVLIPPDAFTRTEFGARRRKNAICSGVATPTAPPLAFFKYATP